MKKSTKLIIGVTGGFSTFFFCILLPILIVVIIFAALFSTGEKEEGSGSGDEDGETSGSYTYDTSDITLTINGFAFPVAGCSYDNINRQYFPSYYDSNGNPHSGVDININVTGKTVVAYTDGLVVMSTAKRDSSGNYISYGEVVMIQHYDENDQVYYTLYGHMLSGSRCVSQGDTVTQGQALRNSRLYW